MSNLDELNRLRSTLSAFQCLRNIINVICPTNEATTMRKEKVRAIARAIENKILTENMTHKEKGTLLVRAIIQSVNELEKAIEEGLEIEKIVYDEINVKFQATRSFISASHRTSGSSSTSSDEEIEGVSGGESSLLVQQVGLTKD